MSTADLRLVLLLVLLVFASAIFAACRDAPVAPSSAGIRPAPGGVPGPNPDRPRGGDDEEAPDKSFQVIGLNAAGAGGPVEIQGVPLGQTGIAVATKKTRSDQRYSDGCVPGYRTSDRARNPRLHKLPTCRVHGPVQWCGLPVGMTNRPGL